MADTSSSSSGIGFVGLLTVLFVGLKLTGHIDWTWWWVLSLMLISAAVVIGSVLALGIFLLVIGFLEERAERKVRRKLERMRAAR